MTAQANASNPIRVDYRRSWYGTWTNTRTLAVGEMKEGSGNQVGSCILTSWLPSGTAREDGASACPLKVGDFVRVVQMPFGNPWLQDEVVLWTGVVLERSPESSGDETVETWTCGGLGALLSKVDLGRYWGGSTESPMPLMGDLFFTPGGVPNQADDDLQYRLAFDTSAKQWTANQVLRALLDWHLYTLDDDGNKVKRFPRWPDFVVGGFNGDAEKIAGALGYRVRDMSARGTLLDALINLMHPRRGLSFIIEPPNGLIPSAASDPCTIRVLSTATEAITVAIPDVDGGGTIDVPASDLSAFVTLGPAHRRAFMSSDSVPRRLSILGKRAVAIVNLRWSRDTGGVETGQLTRGWPVADDSQSGFELKYNDVWRTWRINPEWDGTLVNGAHSSSLSKSLTTLGTDEAPDPLFGAGGCMGWRSSAGPDIPIQSLTILDHIPMPNGAKDDAGDPVAITDWITAPADSAPDWSKPRMRPRVFIHERSGDTWRELMVSIHLTGPTTIQLGDSQQDRARIRSALQSVTADLVILCAVVEPLPFMVSYEPKTPSADQPGLSVDRVRRCPWAEYVWIPRGTCMDVPKGGTPYIAGSDRVVRDDSGTLRQTLALARPIGELPASATIEDRLSIYPEQTVMVQDNDGNSVSLPGLPRAGTLITHLLPYPNAGTETLIKINHIVTSRTISVREGAYGSRIVCELPQTDVEAML